MPTYRLPTPPWRIMLRPIFRKARLLVTRLGAFLVLARDISMRVFTQSAGMLVMQAAAPEIAPAWRPALSTTTGVVTGLGQGWLGVRPEPSGGLAGDAGCCGWTAIQCTGKAWLQNLLCTDPAVLCRWAS